MSYIDVHLDLTMLDPSVLKKFSKKEPYDSINITIAISNK